MPFTMKNAPTNTTGSMYYCKKCLERVSEVQTRCENCNASLIVSKPMDLGLNLKTVPLIDKIGVEMEGYWRCHPSAIRNGTNEVTFHQDGSVHFANVGRRNVNNECDCCSGDCSHDEEDREDGYCNCYCDELRAQSSSPYCGEYVTHPIKYTEDLKELKKIVFDNYPTKVNNSCGGHFHISFKTPSFYGIAMDRRVWLGVKKELRKWAKTNLPTLAYDKLETRLKGVNYCKNSHLAENQVYASADRYTQFNFAWQRHKTMEVRILPMFSKREIYMKCVRFICNEIQQQMMKITQTVPEVTEALRDINGRIKKVDLHSRDDKVKLGIRMRDKEI